MITASYSVSPVLADFGCSERIIEQFQSLAKGRRWRLARVVQDAGNRYRVAGEDGEHEAFCPRSLQAPDERPVVGDWVAGTRRPTGN